LYGRAADVITANDVAHNNLGAAYYKESKNEQAVFHFVEALRIQPAYEAAEKNLKKTIIENGKPLIESLTKLIALFPDNAGLKFALGNTYREENRLKEAAEQYIQAIAIRSDFALAVNNLAIVYSMVGKYDRALALFQRKIELQPDAPVAYYLTACIYAKQHKIDLSVDWLKKSIQMGFDDFEYLGSDPNLENIRHTHYFQDLLKKKLDHRDG